MSVVILGGNECMGVARAPRPQAPRAPRTEVERQYSNSFVVHSV